MHNLISSCLNIKFYMYVKNLRLNMECMKNYTILCHTYTSMFLLHMHANTAFSLVNLYLADRNPS